MAYDPNFPPHSAGLVSQDWRDQFNALKALIDLQCVPIGIPQPYLKNFPGVPPLPGNWAECNGQVLSDAGSPLNGQTLPDLNGASGPQRFLRGAAVSGGVSGADEHFHSVQALDQDHGNGTSVSNSTNDISVVQVGSYNTEPASSLPSYYEVVWAMRVK